MIWPSLTLTSSFNLQGHTFYDQNSLAAYRLPFRPPRSTAKDRFLQLEANGEAPLYKLDTTPPLVASTLCCDSVSIGHRNGSTWMWLLTAVAMRSKPFLPTASCRRSRQRRAGRRDHPELYFALFAWTSSCTETLISGRESCSTSGGNPSPHKM